MSNAKNKFSSHILNTEPEEVTSALTVSTPALKSAASPPGVPSAPITNPPQAADDTPKSRPDYRKTRASKEGKKYINILIDEELQAELKPRIVTRKLTWETLVESLLRRWLEENPGFKP